MPPGRTAALRAMLGGLFHFLGCGPGGAPGLSPEGKLQGAARAAGGSLFPGCGALRSAWEIIKRPPPGNPSACDRGNAPLRAPDARMRRARPHASLLLDRETMAFVIDHVFVMCSP